MAARRLIRAGGWTAVVTAALLAGCAPKKPPPPPPPVPVTPAPAPKPVVLDPQSYMALSASNALFAVRASDMAQERGSSTALRNFASELASDQAAIGAQLNYAGRRINLLPSAQLQPRYQQTLDQLAVATDFDAAYRRQIGVSLRDCVHWHRSFEQNGESPTLRPVARFAASVCEANLEALGRSQ